MGRDLTQFVFLETRSNLCNLLKVLCIRSIFLGARMPRRVPMRCYSHIPPCAYCDKSSQSILSSKAAITTCFDDWQPITSKRNLLDLAICSLIGQYPCMWLMMLIIWLVYISSLFRRPYLFWWTGGMICVVFIFMSNHLIKYYNLMGLHPRHN